MEKLLRNTFLTKETARGWILALVTEKSEPCSRPQQQNSFRGSFGRTFPSKLSIIEAQESVAEESLAEQPLPLEEEL